MADIAITAASVLRSTGQILTGTAGATITQGQPLYLDPSVNKLKLSDSNATTPANSCVGMSLNAASDGQPIDYVATDPAYVCGGTLAAGAVVYVSNTPGGITTTYADLASGTTVISLGVATSTTAMNLLPAVGGVK